LKSEKFFLLSLLVIIFIFAFAGTAFASNNSREDNEDIQAGCRKDNILVLRFQHHEYVCTLPSTAKLWVKNGMAEIIKKQLEPVEKQSETKAINENPLEPKAAKDFSLNNLQIRNNILCREGNIPVFKFAYHDVICTRPSTAELWIQLGLAEHVKIQSEPTKENNQKINISKSNISDKKNIMLPSYPEQPIISPELLKINDYRYPPAVHKVNERIWVAVGYDSANSVMIEGKKGIIIIDTLSTYESAKNVLKEFRKITDKPVKTIIYTSGNIEQVGGTKAFLEEGDGKVEIIAHKNNLNFYVNQNIIMGQTTGLRNQYATGSLLPEEGPDKSNNKYLDKNQTSTISYVPPTNTFSDNYELDISEVKMSLFHIGDESSDQIYIWFPDDKSLLIGDNIYGLFPNTYTLRGGMYNNPMSYVASLDNIIPLEPQSLILSHVKPIIGKEKVQNILFSTRDATQYIYVQTIRGINNGYTVDKLSNMIKLPKSLENQPWLTYQKGQLPWIVKQIYYGTLGWFEGDPGFLQPISSEKRDSYIIDGFGGPDKVLLEVRSAIKNGEYEWAAELATYILDIDPENTEAKLLKAQALRVIGQKMPSDDSRHWTLTKALELEGKIIVDSSKFSQTSTEQLAELPIDEILDILPTKVIAEKVNGWNEILNVHYTDINAGYSLHIRNNILDVTKGLSTNPYYSISLDTDTHKKILTKQLSMADAINSGKMKFQGDLKGSTDDFKMFLDAFDPITVNAQIIVK